MPPFCCPCFTPSSPKEPKNKTSKEKKLDEQRNSPENKLSGDRSQFSTIAGVELVSKSVHFHPPQSEMVASNGNGHDGRGMRETGSIDPSLSNMENPSHIRFQESDLDDINFDHRYVTTQPHSINTISGRVVQKQIHSPTQVCYPNETNTISQTSVNPSEDDTNIYPPSSVSFQPGEEIYADNRGITSNRSIRPSMQTHQNMQMNPMQDSNDVITQQPKRSTKPMSSTRKALRKGSSYHSQLQDMSRHCSFTSDEEYEVSDRKRYNPQSNASRAKKITSTVASVEVDSSKVDKPPNNISEHEISDEKILPTKNQNSISIDAKDEEIMYLRDIIHKLNSELSRCQNNNNADNQIRKAELGNSGVGIRVSPADESSPNVAEAPIPPFGPSPTWLHDLKRLVPLQVAFEEEVKEKSDVIADYEAQLSSLRQEARNIVQDNENLLNKLDKFSAASNVDPDRFIFLAENAEIVVNENELLKEKITNLKRQHSYTENALSDRLKETSRKLRSAEETIDNLNSRNTKLSKENKLLSDDNCKLSEAIKNTMPVKEHEDMVSHLKNVLNQVQSTSTDELNESKRLSQNLSKEVERLSRKVAKYEVDNTRLKCENKVCRKMVQRYDELVAGLRTQVNSGIQERTRLRKELWNNNKLLHASGGMASESKKLGKSNKKSFRGKNKEPNERGDIDTLQENGKFIGQHLKNMNTLDQSRQKEIKLLMRIQKKLLDLKASDINNEINFDPISSPENDEDEANANIISNSNDNNNS